MGSDTVLDSIATLNDSIEKRLTNLLQCGAVETLDINSETFDNLYYARKRPMAASAISIGTLIMAALARDAPDLSVLSKTQTS
ncbi:MAG: hypothetical protein R2788_01740 [Saprospiraceae bacterium]